MASRRHPIGIDLQEFTDSEQWLRLSDGRSIGVEPACRQYLENRLLEAYQAGWIAAATRVSHAIGNEQEES
jgi:hypothetical protein